MRTRSGRCSAVPYPLELNDAGTLVARDHSGREFADMIVDQFEEMLEASEEQPLVFALSLHGFIVGQPFRLRPLRQAIKHCVEHKHADRVWFTRAGRYCQLLLLDEARHHPGKLSGRRRDKDHNTMNRPLTASETAGRTHLLQSRPETVHWGYFDGALPPVLTIESGDRVSDRMRIRQSGMDAACEIRRSSRSTTSKSFIGKLKRGSGNHILTGPIDVNGAKAGDVLEVKILEIDMRQDWGFNLFRSYGGTLPEEFNYYRIIHVALDRAANVATMPSGLKVPLAPFFGQLAVAPPNRLRQAEQQRAA